MLPPSTQSVEKGGRFAMEGVAGLAWNQRPKSVEYVRLRGRCEKRWSAESWTTPGGGRGTHPGPGGRPA